MAQLGVWVLSLALFACVRYPLPPRNGDSEDGRDSGPDTKGWLPPPDAGPLPDETWPLSDALTDGGPPSFAATGGTESTIDTGGKTWRVHVFTSVGDSTFTVVTSDGKTQVEYLIVGGGAGGITGGGSNPWYYHAGGGGGAVQTGALVVSAGSYVVTVGQGGAEDQDGGSSSALGVTAKGGSTVNNGAGGGGTSGAGLAGGLSEGHGGSGGGGGAGAVGGNADWGNTWGDYYFWGGKGGAGVTSDITGQLLGYGGGGSGQGWHFNVNSSISKNGGAPITGDFRALGTDGGATAVHCPTGGTLGCTGCCVGSPPRANSGGGGADYKPRSGADGVVVVRYPIATPP